MKRGNERVVSMWGEMVVVYVCDMIEGSFVGVGLEMYNRTELGYEKKGRGEEKREGESRRKTEEIVINERFTRFTQDVGNYFKYTITNVNYGDEK